MNIELVKDYYGKTLRGSDDLKTKACCPPRPLEITHPEVEEKIGATRFHSATYRLFKIDGLETACEDYGQAVIYRGGVPDALLVLALDSHHTIEKGRIIPVCGNTWKILKESRFAAHFDFLGIFQRIMASFRAAEQIFPSRETTVRTSIWSSPNIPAWNFRLQFGELHTATSAISLLAAVAIDLA
jgi:hypothetical protein